MEAVNQSLDARAPQDTSENAAENTTFLSKSIPNHGEKVNDVQKTREYYCKESLLWLFFVAFRVAHCYYVREMHFEILNKLEIL